VPNDKQLIQDVLDRVVSFLEPLQCHRLGKTCRVLMTITYITEQARMTQLLGKRVVEIVSSAVADESPQCGGCDTGQCGGAATCTCTLSPLTLDNLFPNGGQFNAAQEPQVTPVQVNPHK
jgi:hypothetical protein